MREVGNVEGFQEALSITVGKVEGDEGVSDHVGLTVGEAVGRKLNEGIVGLADDGPGDTNGGRVTSLGECVGHLVSLNTVG